MRRGLALAIGLTVAVSGGTSSGRFAEQGLSYQGLSYQGLSYQGLSYQGLSYQGLSYQGLSYQGLSYQGLSYQGLSYQGLSYQGLSYQGLSYQGLSYQGLSYQGLSYQGLSYQGLSYQSPLLRGVDRMGKLGPRVTLKGIELPSLTTALGASAPHLVLVPRLGASVQGIQAAGAPQTFRELTIDPALVQLQRGPSDSSHGSYIFVPGLVDLASDPDGTKALVGTFWNGLLTAEGGDTGSITYYIAAAERDDGTNSSREPSNSDVYLYTVYYLDTTTQQWFGACPDDSSGRPRAMAVPVDPFDRSLASRNRIAFACTATGVAAKCARNWGYKPWKSIDASVENESRSIPLAPFYDACLIAARADYCQDSQSFTKDGTLIDLFDSLDGVNSLNPTAGLPYAPYSDGIMMHEEYQISALNLASIGANPPVPYTVLENFCHADGTNCDAAYSRLPTATQQLLPHLRRSGMQSSRYADLDPGRSCDAAPFIDRCAPNEPYACYRGTNHSALPYGAFLAVNSPRHCDHNEEHEGDALDPLCNNCVTRVCQIDPTCCGDPNDTFNPGKLVWDQSCNAIRQIVCRSVPLGSDALANQRNLWPAGKIAPKAGSQPVVYRRGAIGAFEGIVDEGGTLFAEGWACDPDYPEASIPVQISIGGAMGTTATPPVTAIAGETLVAKWRETVSAECGGGLRHGFKVPLTSAAGQDVYVYGIDLDLPGAPFSLLRGGKKTTPPAAANPVRAAIWTGWFEPTASGNYTFCKRLPGTTDTCTPIGLATGAADRFRVWVNGLYVAGNWRDTPVTATGAFVLTISPSLPLPSQWLQKGVRYGVRVEYLRPESPPTTSEFVLLSMKNNGTPVAIDSTALYPMAQTSGNGLVGTYFRGLGSLGDTSAQAARQTYGAVDYIWSGENPPVVGPPQPGQPPPDPLPGLAVGDSFTASFEGQVVTPTSGKYTFTADTDGDVKIYVNGELVTDVTRGPPTKSTTCAHDICKPGAAISKTCKQGGFCSSYICDADPYCCSVTWDSSCVRKVADVCKLDCDPTPPIPIALVAGVKAQIKVTYEHLGGPNVRGAKLRLMWALEGTARDAVPQARLFAARPDPEPAPALGVGINAAYFSDADFKIEYLDRVEPTLTFLGTAPDATRTTSMICQTADCGGAGAPGAPALVAAKMIDATDTHATVDIVGRGAADGAAVEIFKGHTDSEGVWHETSPALDTFSIPAMSSAATGGTFTRRLELEKGHYELRARQGASAWSAPIVFEAAHPRRPTPPSIDTPVGGFISGNGNVEVSGTASPGAPVTVTSGPTTYGPFFADSEGHWHGTINLGSNPGGRAISATQSSSENVVSASSPTATVKIALPPLKLTSPTEGEYLPGTELSVVGDGADPNLAGGVKIGDGDGRYFAPREASITLQPSGHFEGGGVSLDYGRHKIKVFQEAGGIEGDGVVRTVNVRPPQIALPLSSPETGTPISAKAVVIGSGLARTGLPGTAIVYQETPTETVLLGEGALQPNGSFTIPVTIAGAGNQTLRVTQTASSLSGGGSAESRPSDPIVVLVRPSQPSIDVPATGSEHLNPQRVPLAGSVLPVAGKTATVTLTAHRGTAVARTWSFNVAPDGQWIVPDGEIDLRPAGNYQLSATQTIDGAESDPSGKVMVAAGDVTPPSIFVTDAPCPNGANDYPPASFSVGMTSAAGAEVTFAPKVCALDGAMRLDPCSSPTATSCWRCLPESGDTFPLGTTSVTCEATDATGNHGTTMFAVTVTSGTGPEFAASDIVVEATGPEGTSVAYPMTATGYLADCAPPGSGEIVPCTSWAPAYAGLGFVPTTVAIDINDPTTTPPATPGGVRHGALYAGFQMNNDAHILRSTDAGANWEIQSTLGGGAAVRQIVVGAGTFPDLSLYVPRGNNGDLEPGGIRVSRDAGRTWSWAVEGQPIHRMAQDPINPNHMVAWTNVERAASALIETRDGWATWTNMTMVGLTGQQILALAIDRVSPERMFLSLKAENTPATTTSPANVELQQVKLYRKVGNESWEKLDIQAIDCFTPTSPIGQPAQPRRCGVSAEGIAIAPEPEGKVYAGTLVSTDAGDNWTRHLRGNLVTVVFDRGNPLRAWAANTSNQLSRTTDGGGSWAGNFFRTPVFDSIVQDAAEPDTIYSTFIGMGLFKSTNAGADFSDSSSWKPVLAPGRSLPGLEIKDIAFDPANPLQAYLVSEQGGAFRTDNGGERWVVKNTNVNDAFTPLLVSKIAVDRFNRNNVYMGGFTGLWKSTNSAEMWTKLNVSGQFHALDPMASDTAYVGTGTRQHCTDPGAGLGCYDGIELPTVKNGIAGQGTVLWGPQGWFGETATHTWKFQFLPGAPRRILMTFIDSAAGTPTPRSFLFTESSNFDGNTSTLDFLGRDLGIVSSHVFFDASDGTHNLFAPGDMGASVPRDSGDALFRISVADLLGSAPHWERLNTPQPLAYPNGQSGPFTAFHRLLVDPAGGGQVMYAVGGGASAPGLFDSLWESRDGGQTWRRDASAPPYLTNAWLSPVDGAIYATISPSPPNGLTPGQDPLSPGVLWKRTRPTVLRPGTRVVRGELRANCTGGDGSRAVTSGSMFPITEIPTSITCSATDAFEITNSRTITIKVQDTTPPVIVVPPVVLLTTTDTSTPATAPIPITVTDIVDGDCMAETTPPPACRPVCVPELNTAFSLGRHPVNCTSTDSHGNAAHATFDVVVSLETLAAPTLTTPGDLTLEAMSAAGRANVIVAVSAATGGSTPTPIDVTCTAPIGPGGATQTLNLVLGDTFPIDSTEVTCSATDTTQTTHLTVKRSFRVIVKDTTPPLLGVPLDFELEGQGEYGRTEVGYVVTATDTVDGDCMADTDPLPTCRPVCVPESRATFPLGKTTVTCRSADKAGNRVTETFDVTITGLPPVIIALDQDVDAQDQLGAYVTYRPTASNTAGQSVSVNCVPSLDSPSGTWFPFGVTEVSCRAEDGGRETQVSFKIRVADLSGPNLSVPSNSTEEATGGDGKLVTFQVSAIDAVDGACAPPNPCVPVCTNVTNLGVATPVVSPAQFPVGDNHVSCTSTDRAGNPTTAPTFTITIRDTRAPDLHNLVDITVDADPDTATKVVDYAVSASDVVSGNNLLVACTPKTGSRFPIGTTDVNCIARDAAGNEARGSFHVTVNPLIGKPCGPSIGACATGQFCVDGVCCTSSCGDGANDCQACSIAAGAPANGVCVPLPSTRVCREAATVCDLPDRCDGTSLECPTDRFAPDTTVCREAATICDAPEKCTGASAACPIDTFASNTIVCREAATICDAPEKCTGASAACPIDTFASNTIVCREAATICDAPEKCTGASAACPIDTFAPNTTVCREAATVCDRAERCTGASTTCPIDGFEGPTTVCRPKANSCDIAENCTGASATCPADATGCGPPDTTPPVFSNVPGMIIAYATCTDGAKVTYTKPTATDAVDGVRPVDCKPPSGSMFPVNKSVVTCTASDTKGNTKEVKFTVWVQYQAPTDGTFFLKPIRSNGGSVFRIGRPVPVRFRLTGASKDITNLVARLIVTKTSNNVQGTVEDVSNETVDDTDFIFKYRPLLLKWYAYRWKTRDQTKGTFLLRADLGDGVLHEIKVSLKAPQ